jgi:CelD/BcsL family acetyltransferase involved in cellulose biosynthesis
MALASFDRPGEVSFREWEDVLSRSFRPTPFLSPLFLLPWARTFASGRPMRVLRWERGGRAEGFLFLCRCESGDGWEFLGGEQVADALDAVVSSGMEEAFWDEVLSHAASPVGDGPLVLQSLVEGTPTLSVLPRVCRERGISCLVEETDRAPFIALPSSFEEYLASLGKKERHELRRKLRRAAEAVPGLSFRITSGGEELARDFPSFVALHRLSHPDKKRFMDARMEAFFRELAEGFLSAGRLRLAFLSGPDGDLAAMFQFSTGGALLLYNSGFDARMGGGASPGVVLLSRCIEDAIGGGLREYDFLRGRERYKYDLGGRDRIVYRATLRRA